MVSPAEAASTIDPEAPRGGGWCGVAERWAGRGRGGGTGGSFSRLAAERARVGMLPKRGSAPQVVSREARAEVGLGAVGAKVVVTADA